MVKGSKKRYRGGSYKRYQPFLEDTATPMPGKQGTPSSVAYWGASYPAAKAMYLTGQNVEPYRRRKAFSYYGPGDYRSFFKSIVPDGTFSHVGRTLGGMTGIPGMNAVGSYLGNKVSKWAGFGDYGPVSTNAIMDGGGGSQQQISVNQDDMSGDVWVTRTEFLQNITATIGASGQSPFAFVKFGLNPGLSETFPFLAQIAANFVMYDMHGLVFSYKPISGENNNVNNALGKVIMATQYDPAAPDFTNSVQMENYDYSNSTKPSCGMHHGVETDNQKAYGNMMYVRTGATTRDRIFTDLGSFYIATEGIPGTASSTVTLGELWVSYKVRLSRAQLFTFAGNFNDFYRGSFITSNGGSMISGAITADARNTLPMTLSSGGSTLLTLTWPSNIVSGLYMWHVTCAKPTTSQSTVWQNSITVTNGTSYNPISLAASNTVSIAPSQDSATLINRFATVWGFFLVNAPGNTQATLTVTSTSAWTLNLENTVGVTVVQVPNFIVNA